MLCLVQFIDGVPHGHTVAKDLRDLRRNLPAGFQYKAIDAVLARLTEEPKSGEYGLGDGYWLLVSRRPGWLARLLGSQEPGAPAAR